MGRNAFNLTQLSSKWEKHHNVLHVYRWAPSTPFLRWRLFQMELFQGIPGPPPSCVPALHLVYMGITVPLPQDSWRAFRTVPNTSQLLLQWTCPSYFISSSSWQCWARPPVFCIGLFLVCDTPKSGRHDLCLGANCSQNQACAKGAGPIDGTRVCSVLCLVGLSQVRVLKQSLDPNDKVETSIFKTQKITQNRKQCIALDKDECETLTWWVCVYVCIYMSYCAPL